MVFELLVDDIPKWTGKFPLRFMGHSLVVPLATLSVQTSLSDIPKGTGIYFTRRVNSFDNERLYTFTKSGKVLEIKTQFKN